MANTSRIFISTSFFLILLIATPLPAVVKVKVATKPDRPWKEYETRTLRDLRSVYRAKPDSDLDQYGGLETKKHQATGFFYPKKVADRWWLIDPEGSLYLHKGVVSVSRLKSEGAKEAAKKKFRTKTGWAEETTQLLRDHYFTGLGSWCDNESLRKVDSPLVYSKIWNFMSSYGRKRGGTYQRPGNTGYPNDCIFVFDPEFETFCDEHAKQLAKTKDDPWLLGHFSDNEMPLWRACLKNYLGLPKEDPGYLAAKSWLEKRHGRKADVKKITEKDEIDFLEVVAERYFRIVSQAIKKHDPNHLYLGSRFNGRVLRYPEVYRAAGKYVDVVSVNYYKAWTADQERMTMWNRESNRPILITEWYAKGMDSGLANTSGAGWVVKTQRDRGRFYQNFTLSLIESKVCVGWDWFKYIDNDPTAKGVDPSNVDSNKGIVSNRYKPYRALLSPMRQINERSYQIVEAFDEP